MQNKLNIDSVITSRELANEYPHLVGPASAKLWATETNELAFALWEYACYDLEPPEYIGKDRDLDEMFGVEYTAEFQACRSAANRQNNIEAMLEQIAQLQKAIDNCPAAETVEQCRAKLLHNSSLRVREQEIVAQMHEMRKFHANNEGCGYMEADEDLSAGNKEYQKLASELANIVNQQLD